MKRTLLAAALLAVSACSRLGIGDDLRVGVIQSEYLHTAPLAAPDTVHAGAPLTVTITTLGYNGCFQAAATRSSRQGQRVTLVPYDRVVDGACTQALREVPRTATLYLDAPGTTTLVLQGVAGLPNSNPTVTFEKTVTVLP